jgi:hypothetical protein
VGFWDYVVLLAFITGGLLLFAVSVIFSGKCLIIIFPFHGREGNTRFFRCDEAFLGLSGVIAIYGVSAFLGGQQFYHYAASNLGIDAGPFFTLCFASAIITAILSWIFRLLTSFRPSRSQEEAHVGNLMRELEEKAGARANSVRNSRGNVD